MDSLKIKLNISRRYNAMLVFKGIVWIFFARLSNYFV